MTTDDAELSAVVACRPAGGRRIAAPTSDDLDELLPDPQRCEAVRRTFARLGFGTTAPVAGSFSITAPRHHFAAVFSSVDPVRFSDQWLATATDAERELPLEDLTLVLGDLVGDVQAVFFTGPPAFGPGNP
jgi:hypothetical protein